MSIVHEAVCDGCGKREPARSPKGPEGYWEMFSHPEGWFMVQPSGPRLDVSGSFPIESYCSRACVALKDSAVATDADIMVDWIAGKIDRLIRMDE